MQFSVGIHPGGEREVRVPEPHPSQGCTAAWPDREAGGPGGDVSDFMGQIITVV